jgi:hypothetical protein
MYYKPNNILSFFYISINDIIIRMGIWYLLDLLWNLEKSLVPFLFCFPALKYIYNDTLLNQRQKKIPEYIKYQGFRL